MISREDVALALEAAYGDSYSPEGRAQHERAADAILALIRPEVASIPVQRDERAEKLGERLDAAERQLAQELANLSATAERCRVLEERARQRILDAVPCPVHGSCVPYVLDWIEKARNAEALAANLRRVDNERAIELMRVKRELDAAWLRHTWPCGHISEGTGEEPDRCRICVAEERVRKAEAELENHHGYYHCVSKKDADAAVQRADDFARKELAAAQAALGAKDAALRGFHGAFMAFAHAAVERHHEPFIPRDLAGFYEDAIRAAQSADHALSLTPATMDDAVGRLVRAVDAYTDYPSGDAMTELVSSLSSPALAAWRR